jgi:hypothetical protein
MRGHLDAWSDGLGEIPHGQHLVCYDALLSDSTIIAVEAEMVEIKHLWNLFPKQYNTNDGTSFCFF